MQFRTIARHATALCAVAAIPLLVRAQVTQKPDGEWRSLAPLAPASRQATPTPRAPRSAPT